MKKKLLICFIMLCCAKLYASPIFNKGNNEVQFSFISRRDFYFPRFTIENNILPMYMMPGISILHQFSSFAVRIGFGIYDNNTLLDTYPGIRQIEFKIGLLKFFPLTKRLSFYLALEPYTARTFYNNYYKEFGIAESQGFSWLITTHFKINIESRSCYFYSSAIKIVKEELVLPDLSLSYLF